MARQGIYQKLERFLIKSFDYICEGLVLVYRHFMKPRNVIIPKKAIDGFTQYIIHKKPEVYSGLFILCQVVYSKTKETETLDTISISPIANVSLG